MILHLKPFLGHAAAVLIAAIITLLSPLYIASTSEGEIYILTSNGWVGDAMASYSLNTTNSRDYPMVLWACVLGVAGSMVLLVTALIQKKAPASLWDTLAALAWMPVIVSCLFLAADNFPMPAFTTTLAISDFEVKITAGWGIALWIQVVAGSIALGGTVAISRATAPATNAPALQKDFLQGPAFHKLQAELVIRQSYAGPETEIPEKSTG